MPKDKRKKQKKKTVTLTAKTADKYDLYQRTVQEPEPEVDFFLRVYRSNFKRTPALLREDFCGTAAVCCEWAKRGRERFALGVDIDPEPLEWCRAHNLPKLSDEEQSRVKLVEGDVRDVGDPKADVLAAQNFSFWCFTSRDQLRQYFQTALANLAERGVMVLDMMGGSECFIEDTCDKRRFTDYRYEWRQKRVDPITHEMHCTISFVFRDKSRLDDIFSYEWRLWTMPEVRELLHEAGFARTDVYWEGTDPKTGEGDGEYRKRKHAEADPSWVAYIVAVKMPQ